MHSLLNLAPWKTVGETLLSYHAVGAAVDGLPAPDANSSKFYRWFYKTSNTIAANYFRAFATKLPSGMPNTEENAAKEAAAVPAGPTK